MRALVVGLGAVGTRLARQLVSSSGVSEVRLRDPDRQRLTAVAESLGAPSIIDDADPDAPCDTDVVVLSVPNGQHVVLARTFLAQNQHVVSTADSVADVRGLLNLDAEARERGLNLVVGAGFAPGLSCVLARHAADRFDAVEEIHVAKVGTGGPACARHHHSALAGRSVDWKDGGWISRSGGSGRELCWFPDPIGGQDCYRAALADALVIVPAFPGVERVTSRMGATRRDRLTARLPMMWPTHPEGGPGAVRVEVRGRREQAQEVVVLGAMDRPAVAAGAVAAAAVRWVAEHRLSRPGAAGLAELVSPVPFLQELKERGVRAAVFEGDGSAR